MSISERVLELRRERWGDRGRAAFAAELGLGPSTYNYYERGRTPSAELLARMADLCGVRLRWLVLGQGEKYANVDQPPQPAAAGAHADLLAEVRTLLDDAPHLVGALRAFLDTLRQVDRLGRPESSEPDTGPDPSSLIPVIGRTAAGVAHFWDEFPWARDPHQAEAIIERLLERTSERARASGAGVRADQTEGALAGPAEAVTLVQMSAPDADGVVEFLDCPAVRRRYPDAVAWRIDGDSMAPRFEDSDLVITSPSRPAVQDAPCVARLKGQVGVTCKIYRRETRSVLLIPVNESFKPLRCRLAQLQWAQPVLWRVRVTTR